MSLLSNYIVGLMVRPMMIMLGISLLALLAERALSVVDLVLGWQGSLLIVFEMLSYLVPHYMGLAVPAAFFLGVFMAFSSLSRNSEIDAMMSTGLGLHQIAKPAILAGLVIVVIHLVLSGYVQPFSRFAYRAALYAVTNVSFQSLLSPNVFTTVGNTTYLVSDLSEDKMTFDDLFSFSEDETGSLTITAEHGRINRTEPTMPWQLELETGIQQLAPVTVKTADQVQFLTVRFRTFQTDIDSGQAAVIKPRGQNERELTLPEIYRMMQDPPSHIDAAELSAEFSGRVARGLSIAFLPFLAIPLALGRKRSHQSYGMVVGIILLVIYYEVMQTGEALADDDEATPLVGIWLPFSVYATSTTFLFLNTALRMPGRERLGLVDRLALLLKNQKEAS